VGLIRRAARSIATRAGRQSHVVATLRPAYEKWLVWSSFGRGMLQTLNGQERFRIDPRRRMLFPEVYDPAVLSYLRERIRLGSVCFNVGAHFGVYALCLSEWAGPAGRVYAFEPNPDSRCVLQEHLRLNGRQGRVEVVAAAVSDRPGVATFFAAADHFSGVSRLGTPNPEFPEARASAVEVSVTTIDAFCAEMNVLPDWLVIDIEGYEVAALRGALETVGRRRSQLGIVAEIHPSLWTAAGASRGELEELLRRARLHAVPLTGQTDPLGEYGIVALEYSE